MTDEQASERSWPTAEMMLGHRLVRSQFLDLFGKTSWEWTSKHGKKHRVTGTWLGRDPALRTPNDVEVMDLEIFWIDLAAGSIRNDGVRVIARLHLQDGRTLAGDGVLFLSGSGHFTVRGELVSRADYEQFSEVFGS